MKLKLIEKRIEAKDTKSFWFETEKKVDWIPGQYFYFTIPSPKFPDAKGNTHHFTIFLSPTEGSTIGFTTRMRDTSNYKKSMDALSVGTEIEGEGPEGTFVLDEKEKGPHILLAGGIGITPFRSVIKYSVDKGLKDTLHLIYANSTPEEIAFRKELEAWDKENAHIKVDMTISKPEESKENWTGLVGRIDEALVKKVSSLYTKPTFWVCGPPAFIDAMEKTLGQMRITSDMVRSEKFTGY